jgi:hypothetical protein
MKESSKNILIFLLFIIFIGLSYLLYYSYNYQKKLEEAVPVTTNEVSKILNFKLNGKSIKLELIEKKTGLEIDFNGKKIDTIENGKISSDNLIDVVTYEEKDYLLVSIPTSKYKPFILNDEGKIIYEFNEFDYVFVDEVNNKNIFIDNKQIYIYQKLNEEDKSEHSESEFARKNLVHISSEEITLEFVEFTHGIFK